LLVIAYAGRKASGIYLNLKKLKKGVIAGFYFIAWMIIFPLTTYCDEGYRGNGVIAGKVSDERGRPLPGATLVLSELNLGTVTDNEGNFQFRNLRDGNYTLHVKYIGFASEGRVVYVRDGRAEVEFFLKHTHIELREVIVRESTTGLVDREKSLSLTVANRDFFSTSSSGHLMQSLQRLPGINSMDIGTGISKPIIRGFGFNRLVVTHNNIKQQGQQWGADHGLEIDAFDVERVEILKGPASLIYGSDAMGGALNIRPAVVPQENNVYGEVSVIAQSNNDLLGGSVLSSVNKDGNFFRIRYSYQDYGDYRVPADHFVYNRWVIRLPEQRLKNTSGQSHAVSSTAGLIRSWGMSSITVSMYDQLSGFFPASHGIPNPDILQVAGSRRIPVDPRQKVNHTRVVSNTSWLFNKNRFELDLGFQQNLRQELNPPHAHGNGPLPDHNLELELVLHTFTSQFRLNRRLGENRSFIMGADANLQRNRRGGYNFLLPDFITYDSGLFAILNQRIRKSLFWNAGLRADAAKTGITAYYEPIWRDQQTISHYIERAPSLQKSFLNIAFSSGLSWMPTETFNLKINAGSSFRNPTPVELSANGVHHGSFRHEMGDPQLDPERAWQLDLGLTYHKDDFYVHISPYLNYFRNYLFLNPSGEFSALQGAGQIYRFQQAPALHLGSEIYIDGHLTHHLHTSLGADIVWAQNTDNAYPLPFTPPPSITAELNYITEPDPKWINQVKLISLMRLVGAQNRVARNEPPTGSYALFNAGVNLRINAAGTPLDLQFMVNNIFDRLYKNHLSFYRILELPEPGRNFTLQIKSSINY
jgi:iron complex outermembrane recepter protein